MWLEQVEVKRGWAGRSGIKVGIGLSEMKSGGQRGLCWNGGCNSFPGLEYVGLSGWVKRLVWHGMGPEDNFGR